MVCAHRQRLKFLYHICRGPAVNWGKRCGGLKVITCLLNDLLRVRPTTKRRRDGKGD
jgi:hypothetical protein